MNFSLGEFAREENARVREAARKEAERVHELELRRMKEQAKKRRTLILKSTCSSIQVVPFRTNMFHDLSVAWQILSVGAAGCHRSLTGADISIVFGTGGAMHVCPWLFGDKVRTYEWTGHAGILGAGGTTIPVHGICTICY